jgi:hypothetical protein
MVYSADFLLDLLELTGYGRIEANAPNTNVSWYVQAFAKLALFDMWLTCNL